MPTLAILKLVRYSEYLKFAPNLTKFYAPIYVVYCCNGLKNDRLGYGSVYDRYCRGYHGDAKCDKKCVQKTSLSGLFQNLSILAHIDF